MQYSRPRSISEIARRAANTLQRFDPAVAEFLDEWQSMNNAERGRAVSEEPMRLEGVKDAYLAALAEHLARAGNLNIPRWTEQPSRFLDRPFFAGGLDSLKAILLAESPSAFRRRLIFISENALSRPARVPTIHEKVS